jgi:hypothetical protein
MKRLLLILILVFAVNADARMSGVMLIGAGTASEAPPAGNNTVNVSRGFEADSDPSGWSEVDGSTVLSRYDSGNKHSGTYSMSVAAATQALAYQIYDIGEAKTDVSICFWYYWPASSGDDDSVSIALAAAGTDPGDYALRIYARKYSSNYNIGIRGDGNAVYGTENITANAWYRFEVDAVRNSTSTLRIYNAAGSLIDEITTTANNQAIRYLYFGHIATTATTGWGAKYFDDIGADWTDATYPLWPYEVGN